MNQTPNDRPDDAEIDRAVEALQRGDLVILPTETVYGLACDAANPEAVAKVFAAKGRPRFNPMIAHVTGIEAAGAIATLDGRALALAQAFWPGPLTLVAALRDPDAVCDLARAGLDTVAVRAPDHPVASIPVTWAIIGLNRGRPLAANTLATASGLAASQARP